jgi:hypothetical protein
MMPLSRAIPRRHFIHETGGSMATRRTTMRSRSGTKLYAVRDKSGQFKDIQTYQRAHAADLRRKSKAESALENKLKKVAGAAAKTVRSSVKGAVATVQRAAKQAAKKVSSLQPAGKKLVKSAVNKVSGRPAVKKATKRVAGVRARKAVRKRAAKKA